MTAEEMFEELGYKNKSKNHILEYEKDRNRNITFIEGNDVKKICVSFYYLTIDELKAINKQVEELEWI